MSALPVNPLDVPGVPFEVELLNPNPTARRGQDGPKYRVSFEVDEETHRAFMHAHRSNIRLVARMAVVDDASDESAMLAIAGKQPKERGPHGAYWQHLFGQCQIQRNPDLLAKLQLEPTATTETVKLALRDRFNVQSLTFVGPAQAEDFAQRIGVTWPRWSEEVRRVHD